MQKDIYIQHVRRCKSSTIARFLLSPEGSIICCNAYAAKLFRYPTPHTLEGLSYKMLVPDEFAESLPETISTEHLTNGKFLPRVNRCADGTLITTWIMTQYVYLDNQCHVETYAKINNEAPYIGEVRYKQLSEVLKCELNILKNKDSVCNNKHINSQLQLLLSAYQLTLKELQFCSLLHSGMHTKEIADILNLTVSSIYTFRKRLRKKINLHPDLDLFSYLHQLTNS